MNNDKQKRIQIFEDTLKQIETIETLKNATKYSKEHTILYNEDFNYELFEIPNRQGNVRVINSRTFNVSKGLENVAVLNFASATNPGGGVKNGSAAQEECLCRCSTLYPCLKSNFLMDNFYNYHKNRHNTFYTDRIIYSKDVVVFKKDIQEPILDKESKWFKVNIITSPAPNIRDMKNVNQNELLEIFKSRIEKILKVAIINGNTNIVLGAFGCGAFRNPPHLVARAYQEVITKYRNYFDNIIFAILVTPNFGGDENYKTFSRMLK